ncbi:glycosyltransferase [Herpetosiphon giganteus]|uniref:glycosyltransferase n=1 Tax=Herpetosiphon giganteus TaxID=2029754 RepID=UPI00195C2A04|nr:glycosyltransferase [Herpetosiphon giganteus]MBM7841712.1 glycosyltransferase involved in cell wall biosynthesis [Herpetosiphon giganteus]
MQIALVHDYLNQYGGAERVLEVLHAMFPQAPIYTSIYDAEAMPNEYRSWDIRTSFMQKLPGWRKHFRKYFLLYPSAFEHFDLSAYDLVISSSSAYAKGVITKPGARHLCYCHTPMRFAWRTDDYVKREQISGIFGAILPFFLTYLRLWDVQSSARVDRFIANSRTVAERIGHFYKRPSTIITPPVELQPFAPQPSEDFYLAGGRLVPYKRLDLAIKACTKLGLPLVIFGDGRDRAELEKVAGPSVRFVGKVDDASLRSLYARCRAYLMPGEEDAGIQPLEAMGAGRPVIAYKAGGALDSVIEGQTGRFFSQQTVEDLANAILASQNDHYDPTAIRGHAEQFARPAFEARIRAEIETLLSEGSGVRG